MRLTNDDIARATGLALSDAQVDILAQWLQSGGLRGNHRSLRSLRGKGLATAEVHLGPRGGRHVRWLLTRDGIDARDRIQLAYEYGADAVQLARLTGINTLDAFERIRDLPDAAIAALIAQAQDGRKLA